MIQTHAGARAVDGGEGTDGRRVFPGVFVGSTCGVSTCLTETSVVSALKSVRVCSASATSSHVVMPLSAGVCLSVKATHFNAQLSLRRRRPFFPARAPSPYVF